MPEPAFLFPGQGSQRVGMGAELRETDRGLFDRWFDLADRTSGLNVTQHALEGPMEALTDTRIAQPAIFALSLALCEKAAELGLRPQAVAGHSLGEYTAAVAVGALSAEEGMRLVSERGRLMATAQEKQPGTMAAVVGLPEETVARLCEEASAIGVVVVANLNSDLQTVVSGEVRAVARVVELALEAGAESAVRLPVGAAFHSPLMQLVQKRLAATVERLSWRDPEVPLYANVDGRPVRQAAALRAALLAQITSPVRWADCVRSLRADGSPVFLELGPGRVLTGLSRLVDPDLEAFSADSPAKLDRFLQAHPAETRRADDRD